MKKEIHPNYNVKSKVTCACGNTFEVGSTLNEINIELCSMCHPFYTGKQKLVDPARRVEKFQARAAKQVEVSSVRKGKKVKKERAEKKKAEKIVKVKKDK